MCLQSGSSYPWCKTMKMTVRKRFVNVCFLKPSLAFTMFNKEGNRGKESESHQLTNSGSPSSHLVIFFENAFLQSQESMLSSPIKDIKILQPAGELGAVRYPLPVQETFSHKEPSTM